MRLYIAAERELDTLYEDDSGGFFDESFAFDRCHSRLVEMQSQQYYEHSKAFEAA